MLLLILWFYCHITVIIIIIIAKIIIIHTNIYFIVIILLPSSSNGTHYFFYSSRSHSNTRKQMTCLDQTGFLSRPEQNPWEGRWPQTVSGVIYKPNIEPTIKLQPLTAPRLQVWTASCTPSTCSPHWWVASEWFCNCICYCMRYE